MNPSLSSADFAALSPLLILIVTALLVLLFEIFFLSVAKKTGFWMTLIGFGCAFIPLFFAPSSDNPMLTQWLRFDPPSYFFSFLFLLIGICSACLAASFFKVQEASRGEYYFLLLSSVFGLMLVGAAADFLTLFLGLETLSISLYILCGYMKRWSLSNESAIKYFLMGSLATAFLLYGIALIYGAVGTTGFEGVAKKYGSLSGSSHLLFMGGIAFVTLGLSFKGAIVPFHTWAPDVYEGAPTPVTALMATGFKAGAFAAFAVVFLIALHQFNLDWSQVLRWLAIATMVFGSFVALRQVQLKRFFAYSSISHAGFLLIPMIVGGVEAIYSLEFYLLVYVLATFGAFASIVLVDKGSEGALFSDLKALFWRSPIVAWIMTFSLLTLAGIPPTAGFFAKFFVFKVAFQGGDILLVIVGLLTTILSIFYYLRIVSIMLSSTTQEKQLFHYSWKGVAIGLFSVILGLILSFYPESFLGLK